MATNLSEVITWDQAVTEYTDNLLPYICEHYESDGLPDWPARREAWNNWTDALCKDGSISDWQYMNWSQPPCCD